MKAEFSIAGGVVGDAAMGAPHVYVRVRAGDVCGYGEARPSPRWSAETPESVAAAVGRYFAPVMVGHDLDDIEELERTMKGEVADGPTIGQPIAKAALATALCDAFARAADLSLSGLWQRRAPRTVALSRLVTTRDPDEAAQLAAQAKREGYEGVDLKIGFGLAVDIPLLEAVAEQMRGLFLRVDANQAYTQADAVVMARRMEKLGVDVFEQPLAAGDLAGHAALRRRVSIPVALDESVWSECDVMNAIRQESCDAIVVKLTKMGGPRRAVRCGEIARAAGLSLLGGGLTESSIGFVASAHVFHALDIASPVDLNGPFFLADDPCAPHVTLQGGRAHLPAGPGHGCELDVEKLSLFMDRE